MKAFFTALRFALALLLAAPVMPAKAASRFWNPYIVTGAASGTGGVCRLTISPAIVGGGLTSANTVTTTGITGATGCNVTAAISTVVDSTHIELTGTTFGGVYATGGCVAGGVWSSTNTANWAASSTSTCGSGGSSVPASADTVTLDANSLTASIIPNYDFSITSLTMGAYVGTLDFSVNNNNPTMQTASITGTAVRSLFCGTGSWLFTGTSGTVWTAATGTNLTFTCGSAPFTFTATTTSPRTFAGGGQSYGVVTVSTNSSRGTFVVSGGNTFSNLALAAGTSVSFGNSTVTITNAVTWTGTAALPITVLGQNGGSFGVAIIFSLGAAGTCTWCMLGGLGATGAGSLTATNASNVGGPNTGSISIAVPSATGGVVGIIGSSP